MFKMFSQTLLIWVRDFDLSKYTRSYSSVIPAEAGMTGFCRMTVGFLVREVGSWRCNVRVSGGDVLKAML